MHNRWRCPAESCKKSVGLRDGTFFAKSHLTLQQWMLLLHWWIREYPVKDAAEEAKISERSAIQIYQYFRDICSWRILNNDAPLMLGGPGVIVQIDESLFRHKPKVNVWTSEPSLGLMWTIVNSLFQHHRGRPTSQPVWVFGMCDTSQTPALGVMEIVQNRCASTLLPIMQQHLHSGTVVHSDEWSAYRQAQQLSQVTQHGVVNHSLHFVDPVTGVHTQNVESYWNRVKTKFKRMRGMHQSMLPSYLDEFMWRERHGRSASATLASLCRDIALKYPQ